LAADSLMPSSAAMASWVVDVAQQDDGPQLRGQLVEGALEPVTQVRRLGPGQRVAIAPRLHRARLLGELVVAVAAPLGEVGVRAVRGDPIEPRGELRVAAEPAYGLPGAEVSLLHHVARVLLVTGEPEGQRVRGDVGLADQFLERLLVTVAGGGDQLLLAQRVTPVVSILVGLRDGGQRYATNPRPSVMVSGFRDGGCETCPNGSTS
jgi:hypothetical protein